MNMERKNVRLLLPSDLEELCDFATADLAFISLKLVLKPIYTILTENGEAVCLIKPQFEAGREKVGKHGVVRDISVHLEVVEEITEFAKSIGFAIAGLSFSPIKGPKGNIEYLLYLKKGGESTTPDYAEIVRMSHELLKGGDE